MSISTPALTNFTAGELSPRLDGRVDLRRYFNGCRTLVNFHVHPHGGATRRSGFRFVTETLGGGSSLLVPFEFNPSQTYILEFGEEDGQGRLRVFSNHGVVLTDDGSPCVLDVPYLADELSRLRYVQSNDVLVLVHVNHPPRKLCRLGHAQWELEDMEFLGRPDEWAEDNYPSCCCFFEQRLVLAATPNSPGTLWFSRTGDMTDFRLRTCEAPLEEWRDRLISGSRTGAAGDSFIVHGGGLFDVGGGLRGVDQEGNGCYYRYQGEKVFAPDSSDVTVNFKVSPSSGSEIEAVYTPDDELNGEYWELIHAGDRIVSDAGEEPLDDDAIEVTLAGREGNNIEFLVPRARLWVGTSGGEWTVGGSSSGTTTPENIKANHESSCGSSSARPEIVGFAALFIQRSGGKVRSMAYSFDNDTYTSSDLTLLATHVSGPGMTQLAYAQEPDSILYAVRSDGVLAALTIEQDEQVLAWSRITTQGSVESIAAVHHSATCRDELWAVVRRETGGVQKRFIEFLEQDFTGQAKDAFFVDSGLTYAGEATDTVTGLDHLAGEKVAVLADGAVVPDCIVGGDGSLKIPFAASVIHAGLSYGSVLQPMRLEAGSRRGTSQTKRKRIIRVSIRFYHTLGGSVGPDENSLDPVYFRSASARMDGPPPVWSGDKSVRFPGGWNRDGILTIRQDQPLPMTVLMVVPEVVVNE